MKKEVKEYAERLMQLKKNRSIEDIVDYLNYKYENAVVRYEDNNFIIEGDDAEKAGEEIGDMLNFVQNK